MTARLAVASAPSTGPKVAPKIEIPTTPPITRPRRSGGVSPVSHAVASGHAMPPPAAPWTNRATTSPG